MFNTGRWTSLVEQAYGYKGGIFDGISPELHYSLIQNEIGEYLVIPSFGDFVWLTKDHLHALSLFAANNPDRPIRLKVCSDDPPIADGLSTERDGYVHQIDFESYDEWFSTLIRCKFRNQINQSHRNGLSVQISQEQRDILLFWELHANLRLKKFNEVPQPRDFFIKLSHAYLIHDLGFVITAYDSKSEVVAGIVVLVDGDTAYYKYAAARSSALTLRPNNFLLDRLVFHLDKLGVNKLNLGYTGGSPEYDGLRKYKLSAGATELIRYRMKTTSCDLLNVRQINELNMKVSTMIKSGADLDEVDKFSERYYRLLV